MSERYSRPHTPPGPPPSRGSQKSSSRGSAPTASSSKSLPSKSYDNHSYHKYDKQYAKSSSSTTTPSYSSGKAYADDKYKSVPVGKISEKVPKSKFGGKSDVYSNDSLYKSHEVNYPSERFGNRDNLYANRYPEKGRYDEKYPSNSSFIDKYCGKKYLNEYDSYSEKAIKYPRHDSDGYYSSGVVSHGTYDSYTSYGGERSKPGSYSADKRGGGGGSLADYGGRGAFMAYGGDGYNVYDTMGRDSGDYSTRGKQRGGVNAFSRDKKSSGYGDNKLLPIRSRIYPNDDRRPYPDYNPSLTVRSPPVGASGGGYSEYDHYSPRTRSPERPYLDRYVIGDSVVYGSPGHYTHDLSTTSPHPRPPSPPSPQPHLPAYPRYPASPRRYPSTGRRSPTSQSQPSSQYQVSSLPRQGTSPRRPPSPPVRRPPSPKTPYLRGQSRSTRPATREQGHERARSKDRYSSKSAISRTGSPTRDRSLTNIRSNDRSRGDQDKRKELERRGGSRERTQDTESSKRGRGGERSTDYHNSSSARTWGKDTTNHSNSSQKNRQRDERRLHSPPGHSGTRGEAATRDRRREDSRDGERSRRLEDRLGPTPSQTTQSPVPLPRVSRRPASPRDKRSRRPDDLRLWIESRKSEGGKCMGSPSIRSRPGVKHAARSNDQTSLSRRSRLGDPKKRLGGYKARRRTLPVKRNKILKKYQRLSVKRGAKSGGRRTNKERDSSRGEGDEGKTVEETDKPGSTATIRRVIKKPKNMSLVNRLVLMPRVIRKPTQKLLKDPKEVDKGKDLSSQPSKDESSESDDKGALGHRS